MAMTQEKFAALVEQLEGCARQNLLNYKESGTAGSYYTVSFNWRERQTDEELQQLELIKAFMEPYRDRLVDLEGTRELVCVDGWSAEQIQALLVEVKQEAY
jgi:hypothetical protein